MMPNSMTAEWQAYIDSQIKTAVEGTLRAVNDEFVAPLRKRIAELEANYLHYAGIYSRGMQFKRGALVSHAGSTWYCFRNTSGGEMPGDADSPWQLIAKGGQLTGQMQGSAKLTGRPGDPKLRAVIGGEGR